MNIDMNHKYQTRDGRAVRILCVDGPGDEPVIGIVEGQEGPDTWTANGEWFKHNVSGNWNLVPVPTKHEGWFVYRGLPYIFDTKQDAEHQVRIEEDGRCKRIIIHGTWED